MTLTSSAQVERLQFSTETVPWQLGSADGRRKPVPCRTVVELIAVGVDACCILSSQWAKQTGSRNMADFQHIKCKINGKRRQVAEILHSNRKSGSGNRTAVSKFTPEVLK